MSEDIRIKIFNGKYEVSSTGSIFSYARKNKIELTGKITDCGYREILFTVDHRRVCKSAHRVVAEAFLPNPMNLREVNHKDGNKLNNRLENLEWCSSSENRIHSRDMGLQKYKINMEIADEIRKLRVEYKYSHTKLGEIFGIKKTQVGYILNNKRWKK